MTDVKSVRPPPPSPLPKSATGQHQKFFKGAFGANITIFCRGGGEGSIHQIFLSAQNVILSVKNVGGGEREYSSNFFKRQKRHFKRQKVLKTTLFKTSKTSPPPHHQKFRRTQINNIDIDEKQGTVKQKRTEKRHQIDCHHYQLELKEEKTLKGNPGNSSNYTMISI